MLQTGVHAWCIIAVSSTPWNQPVKCWPTIYREKYWSTLIISWFSRIEISWTLTCKSKVCQATNSPLDSSWLLMSSMPYTWYISPRSTAHQAKASRPVVAQRPLHQFASSIPSTARLAFIEEYVELCQAGCFRARLTLKTERDATNHVWISLSLSRDSAENQSLCLNRRAVGSHRLKKKQKQSR